MWAVFETTTLIHVVPVDKNGEPKQPHMPHEFCVCDPQIEIRGNQSIIIHKEEQ